MTRRRRRWFSLVACLLVLGVAGATWQFLSPGSRAAVTNRTGVELRNVRVGPPGHEAVIDRIEPGQTIKVAVPLVDDVPAVGLRFADAEGYETGSAAVSLGTTPPRRYRFEILRREEQADATVNYSIRGMLTEEFTLQGAYDDLCRGLMPSTKVATPTLVVMGSRPDAEPARR